MRIGEGHCSLSRHFINFRWNQTTENDSSEYHVQCMIIFETDMKTKSTNEART